MDDSILDGDVPFTDREKRSIPAIDMLFDALSQQSSHPREIFILFTHRAIER